jgi:hypothetical protein
MRLEELSVFQWTYGDNPRIDAPGYVLASPCDGLEGVA